MRIVVGKTGARETCFALCGRPARVRETQNKARELRINGDDEPHRERARLPAVVLFGDFLFFFERGYLHMTGF